MAVFYAVMVEVDPKEEATWDDWHTRQHIPDVLAATWLRARHQIPAGHVQRRLAVNISRSYELTSREALDAYLQGEAVTRLRADHYNHFGSLHAPVADDSDSDGGWSTNRSVSGARKLCTFQVK